MERAFLPNFVDGSPSGGISEHMIEGNTDDTERPEPDEESAIADSIPAAEEIRLQEVIARGREAMGRVRRGSKEALTGWLDVAAALHDARRFQTPEGDRLTTERYLQIAKEIGIHNRTDAMDLPRMHAHRAAVFPRCFADEAAASQRGIGYAYPGWRKAFRWFEPAKRRPKPESEEVDVDSEGIARSLAEKLKNAQADIRAERDAHFTLAEKAAQLEKELAAAKARIAELEAQLRSSRVSAPTGDGDAVATLDTAQKVREVDGGKSKSAQNPPATPKRRGRKPAEAQPIQSSLTSTGQRLGQLAKISKHENNSRG